MRLNKLQDNFKDRISGVDADRSMDPDFEKLFKQDDIGLPDRLNIYRNNISVSLQKILMERHELLTALVGEDFLKQLVRDYVRQNPPRSGNLNEYGFDFPSFIDNVPSARNLPYLGDVARLECAWWRAYYAPDATPLRPSALAELPKNDMSRIKLTLHPSVSLIRSNWPVFSIRDMCLTPDKHQEPFDITKGGEFGLTCRPFLKTETHQLGEAELKFLVYLRSGHTIGEAYGKVLAKYKKFDLAPFLQTELKRGLFVSYSISGT